MRKHFCSIKLTTSLCVGSILSESPSSLRNPIVSSLGDGCDADLALSMILSMDNFQCSSFGVRRICLWWPIHCIVKGIEPAQYPLHWCTSNPAAEPKYPALLANSHLSRSWGPRTWRNPKNHKVFLQITRRVNCSRHHLKHKKKVQNEHFCMNPKSDPLFCIFSKFSQPKSMHDISAKACWMYHSDKTSSNIERWRQRKLVNPSFACILA